MTRTDGPIRWNTKAEQIPNREGARFRVLAKDGNSFTEFVYVVAKDGDGQHFLSIDGTPEEELPLHLVIAWRAEVPATMEAPVETNDSRDEAVSYVVIDSRLGPVATGDKNMCLVFIQAALAQQCEDHTLLNPASFRLKKVKQL
jgi:hypothetical protein